MIRCNLFVRENPYICRIERKGGRNRLKITEGNTNQSIADKLFLSVKTVETHRTQWMRRLGIHDLVGLTRYAIRQDIILPEA